MDQRGAECSIDNTQTTTASDVSEGDGSSDEISSQGDEHCHFQHRGRLGWKHIFLSISMLCTYRLTEWFLSSCRKGTSFSQHCFAEIPTFMLTGSDFIDNSIYCLLDYCFIFSLGSAPLRPPNTPPPPGVGFLG